MSQPIETAKQLDWRGWRLGIIRSLVQGGAHSVLGGVAITVFDPKDFAGNQILHAVWFTLTLFVFGGFMRLMFYLNDHPLADGAGESDIPPNSK